MKMYRPCSLAVTIAGVIALQVSLRADITLPKVISDNMVLQRGQAVPIWGTAKPGEEVTVKFGVQKKSTQAATDGKWKILLDPLTASSTPAEMTVSGNNTIQVKNILVGEVWLCSGQSNMEKPMGVQPGQKPTLNSEEEIRNANFPLIRLLKVKKARVPAPASDISGDWVECTPTSLDQSKFSAAGYFFGRKLFKELNVPIGLIDSTWGGTRIESWTPPAGFALMPSLSIFSKGSSQSGGKVAGTDLSTLYNGMIYPLAPFAIQGAIWYQGESNLMDVNDSALYPDKMTALINSWRDLWKSDFSFYYVQIAPHLYHIVRQPLVVSPEAEPIFWEAQTAAMRIPKTGMIVTTDLVNDLMDIHPQNKKDVGERLALWALAKNYERKDIEFTGPVFQKMEVKGNQAVLYFDHAGGGLTMLDQKAVSLGTGTLPKSDPVSTASSEAKPAAKVNPHISPLTWFIVAGADGMFYPGMATIQGDTVVVSSPHVNEPKAVRFAWDEGARPNLANKAGLPALPFRTDGPTPPVLK